MDHTLYKVIVFGEKSVGKTATTIQFIKNWFVGEYEPALGETFRKQIMLDGEMRIVEIIVYTRSQEYDALIDQFILSGEGFILMYSVNSRESFDNLGYYFRKIQLVRDYSPTSIVLVGNKCDLEKERQVSTVEVEEIAQEFKCPFFEISAKSRINIDECFNELVRTMSDRRNRNIKALPVENRK